MSRRKRQGPVIPALKKRAALEQGYRIWGDGYPSERVARGAIGSYRFSVEYEYAVSGASGEWCVLVRSRS